MTPLACELGTLAAAMRTLLVERALPTWLGCADAAFGGFRVGDTAERGCHHLVATGRLTWVFATACQALPLPDPRWRAAADLGAACLAGRLHDPQHGGFVWRTDPDGARTDRRKYLYGQAFALYGLAAHLRMSGDPAVRALLRESAATVLARARDPEHGGWLEHFGPDWRPLAPGMPVARDRAGAKGVDAHLHWLEALCEIARADASPAIRAALAEALWVLRRRLLRRALWGCTGLATRDWRPLGPPPPVAIHWGHLIEFDWLALSAERLLHRPASTAQLARHVWLARYLACNRAGELAERTGRRLRPFPGAFSWWAQAEYLVALTVLSREPSGHRWQAPLARLAHHLLARRIDPSTGLWSDDSGRRIDPFKAGYHEVRAMLAFASAWAEPE